MAARAGSSDLLLVAASGLACGLGAEPSQPAKPLAATGRPVVGLRIRPFPWVGCWLTLGIALRLYHYLRDPAVWHDEAALVLNVLGKSFDQLLGPLAFSEAAPPLFLWLEKVVVLALGDGTYALRLAPLAASCATLFGVVAVARRVLAADAVPWVVLLVGCSDRLLWHSCEAKPYAVDVLVATSLVFLVVWGLHRQLCLNLLIATSVTPLLIFLSYPACFLLGGLALAWLPALLRGRRARDGLLYAAFLTALGGSFLLLLTGPIHAQQDATLRACWDDMFPSWDRPWSVPGWMILRQAETARYANEPVGNLLAAVTVVGAVGLWRTGQRRLVVFLLAPLGLAGVAAGLGQYPLGATRVVVFTAPAILLLTASGLSPTLTWLRQFGRPAPALLLAVVFFPVGEAIYRVVVPWDRADSARAAVFVTSHRQAGEAVLGSNWEHDYYFRTLGTNYQPLDRLTLPARAPSDRLWLVAAGKDERRSAWLGALQGNCYVLEREEFDRTTVFHLQLIPAIAPPGPPGAR